MITECSDITYSTVMFVSLYAKQERKQSSKYNRRLIDNKITSCSNCVGFCNFKEHRGYLTRELRAEHNCLGKKCHYYVNKDKHTIQKDISYSKENLLEKVMTCFNDFDGIKPTSAVRENDKIVIRYVTITNDYNEYEIQQIVAKELNEPVVMKRIECSFDDAVKIIYK